MKNILQTDTQTDRHTHTPYPSYSRLEKIFFETTKMFPAYGVPCPWGAWLILNNAFLVFLEMAPEGSLPVGRILNNIASRCPILRSIFELNLGQIG